MLEGAHADARRARRTGPAATPAHSPAAELNPTVAPPVRPGRTNKQQNTPLVGRSGARVPRRLSLRTDRSETREARPEADKASGRGKGARIMGINPLLRLGEGGSYFDTA